MRKTAWAIVRGNYLALFDDRCPIYWLRSRAVHDLKQHGLNGYTVVKVDISSSASEPARRRSRPVTTRRRRRTGGDSKTRLTLLHHLQYGPLTRDELNDVLGVRTAGIHLAKLLKLHRVRAVPGTRPFRYELVESSGANDGASLVADSAVDRVAGAPHSPSTREKGI